MSFHQLQCHFSEAVWDAEYGLAKVVKPVGKFIAHGMGHVNIYVGGLCLFPEEMVFMMESNNLEATPGGAGDGVPLSMSKAWDIMLKSGVSLEQYAVFSNLSRLGYKVVRHNMAQKLPQVVSLEPGTSSTPVRHQPASGESTLNTSFASSHDQNDDDIEILDIEVDRKRTNLSSGKPAAFQSKDTKTKSKSSKSMISQICAEILDLVVGQAVVTKLNKDELDQSKDSSGVSQTLLRFFISFYFVLSFLFCYV